MSLDMPRSHSVNSTQVDSPNNFCVYPILSDDYGLPEKYAWLNGDGISAGSIRTSKSDGYEMIKQDWHIANKLVEGVFKHPLNICLSEYHVVVLHVDRFQAVSLLNQKVAYENVLGVNNGFRIKHLYLQNGSRFLGITRDYASQAFWAYTDRYIFNYRPVNEARHEY